MFNIFSKTKHIHSIVTTIDNNFITKLEEEMKEDESLLKDVCTWLEKNTDFEKKYAKKFDHYMKVKACIGYLVIAITSGEIQEKVLIAYVDNLKTK